MGSSLGWCTVGYSVCLTDWHSLWFSRQTTNWRQYGFSVLSMVGLSAVDGNYGASQRWLGTSLYHPSSTGSHWRFSDASQYPLPEMGCKASVCAREWRCILAPAKRIYKQTSEPFHITQKHSCIINIPYKSTHGMCGRWCVLAPPSHSGGHQCLVKVVRPACVALYASLASQTALIQIWILRTVHEAN